jgi:hypothetical protein
MYTKKSYKVIVGTVPGSESPRRSAMTNVKQKAAAKTKVAKKPKAVTKAKVKKESPAVAEMVEGGYEAVMNAGEKATSLWLNLPLMAVELLGTPEKMTKPLKTYNNKVVGGVYGGVDFVTRNVCKVAFAPARALASKLESAAGDKKAA